MPKLFERPQHLVLAFMAGLSLASGRSARLYVEKLMTVMMSGAGADA